MINTLTNFIIYEIQSFFAQGIILLLLFGLAAILFGFFLVIYQAKTQIQGEKVDGTIIGAVKDVKVSFKDNKLVKKRLNYGTLWPVYEFALADNIKRQQKGSVGGSHVYKYKTGQNIKLNVHHEENNIFVRESESYSGYILGIIFFLFGAGIIYFCVFEYSSELNIGSFIWLIAAVSLLLRYKDKIIGFIKDLKDYRENKNNFEKVANHKRSFDPEHLHPIEYYVEEREQRRRKHDKNYRS